MKCEIVLLSGGREEGKSRERTKPSQNLLSVERLINEVLGMHHYLISFLGEKTDNNAILSGHGPLIS